MTSSENNNTPPPVLCGARLVEYASADDTVIYISKSRLYVGEQLLERVPNLAICESLREPEILLLYCDEHWDFLAIVPVDSIEEARRLAESEYHGIASKWIGAQVSKEAAERYLDELNREECCSFCGRIPPEIKQMIASSKARICDICITEFFKDLQENE